MQLTISPMKEGRETGDMAQLGQEFGQGDLDAVTGAFSRLTAHQQAGEAAWKAVTYFTNNRHRMRYAEFRTRRYQIGSGTIESACKQMVTQRMKVSDAIWNIEHATKTAKARAALLSGQWKTTMARREHISLAPAA